MFGKEPRSLFAIDITWDNHRHRHLVCWNDYTTLPTSPNKHYYKVALDGIYLLADVERWLFGVLVLH